MSQRFGPIVSAHTCCPPEKTQLPEFVVTIVVVMNPELSKPYDPMHMSLVRN